jgi:Mrp family chromosome partitioning ATPase/cell division protein FtsN
MERGGKTFIVTSSSLQEGKTTTIVNLAITLAQMGQKTLIVGANLRRPSIYKIFGIEREPGLSDILLGNYRWEECVRTVADILMGRFEMEDVMMTPGLDNLHLITAGSSPPNPSELLGTPQMAEFIRQVRERYDIVLFDTPPVLPVADAAILASQVDGVLLCYQAGKVGRVALRRAKIHLENARGRVWGVVLNDIRAEISGYTTYHHYYTHYYSEDAGVEGPPATGIQRIVNRISGLFSRPSPPTEEVEQVRPMERPTIEQEPPPEPRRRYAHFWLGVLLLIILAALLTGFLMWRFGLWSPMRSGSVQELLKSRWSELVPWNSRALPLPAVSEHDAAPISSETSAATSQPESAPAQANERAPTPETETEPPRSESRLAVIASRSRPAAPPAVRYALEFGPFVLPEEADHTEALLNQAGLTSARFRRQSGGNLFTVFIEGFATAKEAQDALDRLRADEIAAVPVGGRERREQSMIRVGEPAPLRVAVQMGERLRAKGFQVRVAAQSETISHYTIRHGSFATREEAEAKSQELTRNGLPNSVVQLK